MSFQLSAISFEMVSGTSLRQLWKICPAWLRWSVVLVLLLGLAAPALAQTIDPRLRLPREFFRVQFVTPDRGWLLEGGRLLHTVDGGQTWAVQRPKQYSDVGYRAMKEFQFLDAQYGWVLYVDGILHRTTDGGQTWQVVEVRPQIPREGRRPERLTTIERFTMVSPQIGFGLNEDGDRALRTADGGQTWRTAPLGPENVDFTQLAFPTLRDGYAAARSGRLYRTTDGAQTWQALPATPIGFPVGMQFLTTALGWIYDSTGQRLYRTTDGGQAWQACAPAPAKIRRFVFRSATLGWAAASENGIVLKTTDGCATWQAIQTPAPQSEFFGISFATDRDGWVVGDNDAALKTTDGGLTWTPLLVNVP